MAQKPTHRKRTYDPDKHTTVVTSHTLPESTLYLLTIIAKKAGLPRSRVVDMLLKEAIQARFDVEIGGEADSVDLAIRDLTLVIKNNLPPKDRP